MGIIEITIGFILDLIIGDPQNNFHPIRFIGLLSKSLENIFRKILKNHLKLAGFITWFIVVVITYSISYYIIHIVNGISRVIITSIIIYFCICIKSLRMEGLKVIQYLDDIQLARKQLSYIVGRDTENLDRTSIIRAVIETISENMSDGIIAPFFYLGVGAAPLMITYKAINTLDSMFGYKNNIYRDFGYFPAKLDDIFSYIPARITSFFIILSSFILKLDYKNSYKIYKRDKNNHSSLNSAHPESCVAGALGIMLGGSNYYFGELVKKPTIGNNLYEIQVSQVYKTNQILYLVSFFGYFLSIFLKKVFYG